MPPRSATAEAIRGAADFVPAWPGPDMSVAAENRRAAPAFPLEVLGPASGWVQDTAAGAGPAPVDYVACATLAVAGSLIGNARWVSPWPSWREPPVLWIGLVGDPSSSKSPALKPLMGLLRRLESEMAADFDDTRRQWLTAQEAADARKVSWQSDVKAAAKAGDPVPPMPADAEAPPEPARPRIVLSDCTVEATAAVLAGQPRGVLLYRDELTGWLAGMGAYKAGNGSDRAFWLEASGGGPFTVDRVRQAGKPLRIDRLAVGLLGGIQPDRLVSQLLVGDDDGLAARLLLSWPDPVPPSRPTVTPDDAGALRAMRRLLSLEMAQGEHGPEPALVPLDDDAADMFDRLRSDLYARTQAAAGRQGGHFGKLPGLSLRIAMALEHLWWCWSERDAPPARVSARAVVAAGALVTGYFVPMSERCYGDAARPEADRLAAVLGRWILATRPERINLRELRRTVRLPGLASAEAIRAAVDVLVEADWLSPSPERAGDTPGRGRADYAVNPELRRQT